MKILRLLSCLLCNKKKFGQTCKANNEVLQITEIFHKLRNYTVKSSFTICYSGLSLPSLADIDLVNVYWYLSKHGVNMTALIRNQHLIMRTTLQCFQHLFTNVLSQ